MNGLREHGSLVAGILASFLLILISSDYPFFWDTIQLGSKHADWYFSQETFKILLPTNLDSGHFPLFGMYLAFFWSSFGKTLLVSHLAILPFLILIVFFTLRIGEFLTNKRNSGFFLLLLFCNPYFLGQAVLVSPDICLLAFFLGCIYSIIHDKKIQLLICAILLSLISQRGLLIVFALGGWLLLDMLVVKNLAKSNLIKYLIPGVVLAISFQAFHYTKLGWVSYHPDSPWMASFQNVDTFFGLARNTGVYMWRLFDFGNGFVVLGLFLLIVRGRMRESKLMPLLLLLLVFFALVIIPKSGLLNHRYFLPMIVLGSFCFLELLYKSDLPFKKLTIASTAIVLLAGNFWFYPEGVAHGWDSTLGHTPYYNQVDDALVFIEENGIAIEEVGTAFPAINKLSDIYLSDDDRSFKKFDLDRDKYILYSNVMNDFDSEHLFELDNTWKIVFKSEKVNIVTILYKRK